MVKILTKLRKSRGFTLIEVIVVTIIVATSASLAIINYTDYLKRVRNQEAEQVLIALYGAQLDYRRDSGSFYGATGANESLINANMNITIPPMKNFQSLLAMNNQSVCSGPIVQRVGQVTAVDGSYNLAITNTGSIICFSTTGTCGIPICRSMGYRQY